MGLLATRKPKKRRRTAGGGEGPQTSRSALRTKTQLEAAAMVADGQLSIPQIAAKVGVSEKTIDRWTKLPVFKGEIDRILAETEKGILTAGIASRTQRLRAANQRWKLMMRIISERAADPEMAKVPGGTTGALVRQLKSIGFGENNKVVEEFAFDAALFKELRELERHAAQELGQYGEVAVNFGSNAPKKVVFEWKQSTGS